MGQCPLRCLNTSLPQPWPSDVGGCLLERDNRKSLQVSIADVFWASCMENASLPTTYRHQYTWKQRTKKITYETHLKILLKTAFFDIKYQQRNLHPGAKIYYSFESNQRKSENRKHKHVLLVIFPNKSFRFLFLRLQCTPISSASAPAKNRKQEKDKEGGKGFYKAAPTPLPSFCNSILIRFEALFPKISSQAARHKSTYSG